MTATTTTLTLAERALNLTLAANEQHPSTDPNHRYHRAQFVARVIANDEREAYAIEDRRTIRTRFTAALRERMQYSEGRADAWIRALHIAENMSAAYADAKPSAMLNELNRAIADLRRAAEADARVADRQRQRVLSLSDPASQDAQLIAAAERGDLIEPSMLLATVPDEFGRVSPFAVTHYASSRSYTSRNLGLFSAYTIASTALDRGERASVHFDSCG